MTATEPSPGSGPGRADGPDLVDVHSHFLTERYVESARRAGISQPDGTPQWPTWSESDHLRLMDANRIGTAVLSISTPGVGFVAGAAAVSLARHVNAYGSEIAARRPDRFGHFAALPLPDVDAACVEAAYALDELGSGGVAVETQTAGLTLGDPSLDLLWQLLDDRAAVVFVHPTSPPGWQAVGRGVPNPMMEFLFESARVVVDLSLRSLHTRFPSIAWVFTHSAGVVPLVMDRVDALRPVFLPGSTATTPVVDDVTRLWFDLAGTPFPRAAPFAAAQIGTSRLVYGSDYCFTAPEAVAAQVAALDAADPVAGTDWRTLTTDNARRLLGRGTGVDAPSPVSVVTSA